MIKSYLIKNPPAIVKLKAKCFNMCAKVHSFKKIPINENSSKSKIQKFKEWMTINCLRKKTKITSNKSWFLLLSRDTSYDTSINHGDNHGSND